MALLTMRRAYESARAKTYTAQIADDGRFVLPTQRLRTLNKLKARQPVLLGQKLQLDYGKVSRESFEHAAIPSRVRGSFTTTFL